jgi:hypothetical protein
MRQFQIKAPKAEVHGGNETANASKRQQVVSVRNGQVTGPLHDRKRGGTERVTKALTSLDWKTFDIGARMVFLARAKNMNAKFSVKNGLCARRVGRPMSIWHGRRRFVGNPGGIF